MVVGQDACLSALRLLCRKAPIGGEHALSCLTTQLTRILTLGNRVLPVSLAMLSVYVYVYVCGWVGGWVRVRVHVQSPLVTDKGQANAGRPSAMQVAMADAVPEEP